MAPELEPQSKAVLWLSLSAAALALIGLLGNVLDIEWLVATIPGRPRMQLGTAVGIGLLAAGIMLQRGQPGRAWLACAKLIGAALVLYGMLIVWEYASHVDLGIDWRLRSTSSLGPHPGRPSPFAAMALGALGAALLLRDVRSRLAAAHEALCLLALFIAFTSLIGHAFGAGALYQFHGSRVIGVALPTGVSLTALAVAAWIASPRAALLRIVMARGPGGVVLRRLGSTAVFGAPLLGGMLLLSAKAAGLRDLSLILAIGSVLGVVFAVALLAITALRIEDGAATSEQNRMRAQELFEQAPEGIFIADLSGRYTDVNEAGCRLLGHTRDEILGKSILDLIPESDVERLWHERSRMLEGAVHVAKWKLRRKDGTYAETEVTAKILPDGRWQGFVRDISERLELERNLLESREFMTRVLESSTEYGIVAEDLGGRVVLWNEGARRNYGYEASEICGRPSHLLVASAQLDAWSALRARAVDQGMAEGTLLARRKDGTTFAASIVCTRRLSADKLMAGVLLVTRDLTVEQRYLAEQEFLSRVGMELATCLEYRETVACVSRLATSFLGDLAAIDLVQNGAERRVMAVEREGGQEVASAVAQIGPARAAGHPLQTVIESKQPLLLADIGAEDRARFATSPEHARVLETVRATSAMLVPLIARGQLLAVLSITARDGSRRYGPDDLRLAMELARRAALKLDNVQLLQQLRLQGAVTTNLAEAVILVRAADSKIVYANPRCETMFGCSARELVGLPMVRLHAQPSRDGTSPAARIAEQLDSAGAWHGEVECARRDGSLFWCSVSASNFEHDEHGRVWIALYTDITERKRLEQQTARALDEKEVLLKEIHHRVKNNLQVISSLFSLQRERTQSAELKRLLDESRTRVESIALVHEQLYRSADLVAIDFDEYLRNLVGTIRSSYGAENISSEVSARNVVLEIDQAVPCALLVCELVSNSFKHAFGTGSGRVWVRAERDAQGFCVLDVGDDGCGLPSDLDWTKTRSLGLRLAHGLARQLRATASVECANGTAFRLRFPSWNANKPVAPTGAARPAEC